MEGDPARPREITCRACEKISQAPAPFSRYAARLCRPSLLAMILFEKYGQHQPLNRQSERYAREGVDLSLSTLADQVGACATALRPLHALMRRMSWRERLHGDDRRSDPGERQDRDRPRLGLCARRQTVWRRGAASSSLLCLPRPNP